MSGVCNETKHKPAYVFIRIAYNTICILTIQIHREHFLSSEI
jgi:hypothetical protein